MSSFDEREQRGENAAGTVGGAPRREDVDARDATRVEGRVVGERGRREEIDDADVVTDDAADDAI